MKEYTTPELACIRLDVGDIITTSPGTESPIIDVIFPDTVVDGNIDYGTVDGGEWNI